MHNQNVIPHTSKLSKSKKNLWEKLPRFYIDFPCFFTPFHNRMTNILIQRFYKLPLRSDFIFKFTSMYKRQQELLKILHGFTDSVIVARREELEKQLSNGETVESKALIDVLLTSTIDGKPMSNEDIREEIDTFSFAGR
jgi:cytochrome P450 family 4